MMKKTLFGFLMFAVTLMMFSCKNSSSPSAVAENFAKAMIRQDFVTAKQYVLSQNAAMFDQMSSMAKEMPMPDSIKNIIDKATVKASNEKITDSTATVDITFTLPQAIDGKKEDKQTVNLKKEKGAWKVDLGMPDMMPEDNMQSSQTPADSALAPLPTKPDSAEK